MNRLLVAAVVLVLPMTGAEAQERRRIGPWDVSTERDRFGDGNDIVAAVQISRGMAFAVRCLANREFSFGIMEVGFGTGRLSPSMSASAAVRVDDHPIERPVAGVVNDRLVQINFPFEKASQLLRGREIAIRLEVAGGQSDHVFRLTNAERAIGPVIEACRPPGEAPVRLEPNGMFEADREVFLQRMDAALRPFRAPALPRSLQCSDGGLGQDLRYCKASVGRLEIEFMEYKPEGADGNAFRTGTGPGPSDTFTVRLKGDGGSRDDHRRFAALCAAAIKAAAPSTSMQSIQRRVEQAIQEARRKARPNNAGLGQSDESDARLEIEVVTDPNSEERGVSCIVLAIKAG